MSTNYVKCFLLNVLYNHKTSEKGKYMQLETIKPIYDEANCFNFFNF